MDILVPEGSAQRSHPPSASDARIWGLVAAAVVVGMIVLIATFERADTFQVASGDVLRQTPVIIAPQSEIP